MASKRAFTVQAQTGGRRRAATQDELLSATKRLLAEGSSLASLSVERIVTEAGVVRSTFYLHFRDKYDLIERLAGEQEAWIEAAGQTANRDPELRRATVCRIVADIVDRWVENHAVLSAIIELAEYDPRMAATWQRMVRQLARVAAGVFTAQWERSDTQPRDPEMVAESLAWMLERCCHEVARDLARQDTLAESLTEIIWRVLHPDRSALGD